MECKQCGTNNREKANFCTHCGKKLKETCNCWMKNGQPYNCGSESCPGYKLPIIKKSKL